MILKHMLKIHKRYEIRTGFTKESPVNNHLEAI